MPDCWVFWSCSERNGRQWQNAQAIYENAHGQAEKGPVFSQVLGARLGRSFHDSVDV